MRNIRVIQYFAMPLCLLGLACPSIAAQTHSSHTDEPIVSSNLPATPKLKAGQGAIQGTVTDYLGEAVPGVKLTLTNNETNSSKSITTGECGTFFLVLPAGTYSLVAVLPGLKMYSATNIVIRSLEVVNLPIQLHLEESGKKSKQTMMPPRKPSQTIPPCNSPAS